MTRKPTTKLVTAVIQWELNRLPPKTSLPLKQLLEIGQLDEPTIATLIDAATVSQDPHRLLAFTAGYLHMRANGIPVHDVIALAKANNRRINLAWSPTRWKDEHDKLSRVEALKRLAEENVTYDVSAFTQHLPPNFPGYVIRTSRKLGMEGLRQRHCVAAYHDKIRAGKSAIAAIFLAGQRWTTELQLTGDAEAPILIAQIKTRLNQLPPPAVRKDIHDLLGIALKTSAVSPRERSYLYMQNLQILLPIMRQHAITLVTVYFDGSGDDGSIESIEFLPQDHTDDFADLPVEILTTQSAFDDGHWVYQTTPEQMTLKDAIETITYDYLEETDTDWVNNDGGFGNLEIDVSTGTVTLEVNTRYTESTTEYSAERDIATGAEL